MPSLTFSKLIQGSLLGEEFKKGGPTKNCLFV